MLDAEVGTWRYDPDAQLYYFSSELSLGHGAASAPVPLDQLQADPASGRRRQGRQPSANRLTNEGGSAVGEMRYRNAKGGWITLRVHYRSGRKLASGRYEMFGISQNVSELADCARPGRRRLRAASSWRWRRPTPASSRSTWLAASAGRRISSRSWSARRRWSGRRPTRSASITTRNRRIVRESWERCRRSHGVERIDTRLHRPDGEGPLGAHLHPRPARRGRRAPARRRPDARHRQPEAPGTRAGRGQAAGRGGDRRQVQLPRLDEPRDPDAAQRHSRHGAGAGGRRTHRGAEGARQRHLGIGPGR